MAVTKDFRIKVSIDGDKSEFKGLTTGASEFSASIKEVSKDLKTAGDSTSGAALKFTELNSAIEIAGKLFNLLAAPVHKAIEEFIAAEKAQTNLSNTLVAMGFDAQGAMDDFVTFSKEMQRTTTMSDDLALELASVGKSLGLTNERTKTMIKTAVGLSTAIGTDVRTAFNDLSGQLNGVAGRTSKFVSGLKDLTEEQLKAGMGIELTAKQFEKFAELSGKSLAGALEQSKNAFGDIFEEVGKVISEFIDLPQLVRESTQVFLEVTQQVENFGKHLTIMKDALVAIPIKESTAAVLALSAAIAGAAVILNSAAILAAAGTFLTIAATVGLLLIKFVLITAAILAVILVVDTLIANLDRLKVFGVILQEVWIYSIKLVEVAFYNLITAILEGFNLLLTPLASISDTAGDVLKSVGENITQFKAQAKEAGAAMSGVGASIETLSKSIFKKEGLKSGTILNGLIKGVDALKKGMSDLAVTTKKSDVAFRDFAGQNSLKKSYAEAAEAAKLLKKLTEDLISDIKKLEDQTKLLNIENEKYGKTLTEVARIDEKYALQAASNLRQRMKDLKLEDKQLLEIIKRYEEAVKIKADLQVIEAGKKEIEKTNPVAQAIGKTILEGGLLFIAVLKNTFTFISDFFARNFGKATVDNVTATAIAGAKMFDSLSGFLGAAGVLIGAMIKGFDNFIKGTIDGIATGFSEGAQLIADYAPILSESLFGKDFAKNVKDLAASIIDEVWIADAQINENLGPEIRAAIGDLSNTLGTMGAIMGTVIDGAITGLKAIIGSDLINGFSGFLEGIGNLPDEMMKAFSKLGEIVSKLLNNFGTMLNKFLTMLPQILSKLAAELPKVLKMIIAALPQIAKAIIDAIPTIIQAILDAIPDLIRAFSSIIQMLVAAIPDIITQIMDALPGIVQTIFEEIPKIFQAIFKAIPTIIENFLEHIDEFVLAFVDGFISAVGEIVASFIDEFLMKGGLERIVGAILRAIPKIIIALVQGVIRGLVNALSSLFGKMFGDIEFPESITNLPDNISTAADKLGKKIAKEASQIFQVKDLENAAAAISGKKQPDQILADAISSSTGKLRTATEILRKMWQWVWDKILAPSFSLLRASWLFLYETVVQPMIEGTKRSWEALRAVWSFINTATIQPMINALRAVWGFAKSIWDTMMSVNRSIWEGVKNFFSSILKGNVNEAFKGVFDTFKNIGNQIWEGLKAGLAGGLDVFKGIGSNIWDSLKDGLAGLGDFFKNTLDEINPANILGKLFKFDGGGMGDVEKALSRITGQTIDVPFAQFAQGGTVPGNALMSGDSAMNDRILALLSPGEAVIPRSKMNDPFIGGLIKAILEGTIQPPKFFEGFGGQVTESIGGAVSSVGGAAQDAYSSGQDAAKAAAEAAKQAGGSASDEYKKAIEWLAQFDPQKLWEQFKDRGMASLGDMFNNADRFHSGGLVPAFAGGGEVPAILQPGEFVINRRSTQNNQGLLSSINSGRNGLAGNNNGISAGVNIEKIEINAKTMLDADQIRREVIPAIERDLKRKSLDGKYLIASTGVRTR